MVQCKGTGLTNPSWTPGVTDIICWCYLANLAPVLYKMFHFQRRVKALEQGVHARNLFIFDSYLQL